MQLTTPYRILILTVFVLGIYYPTLSGSANSIDDYKMLMDFELTADVDFSSLFKPGTTFYYRPLIGLSFVIDKALWRLEPSFMLLENILLQLFNAALVFFVARKAGLRDNIALIGALIFAAHPLATESVNWVSGRTDLLATFFHLVCVVFLIQAVEKRQRRLLMPALFFFCGGVLAKEMSVIFLAADGLVLLQWPSDRTLSRRCRDAGLFVLPIALAGGLLLLYRALLFGGSARGFSFLLDKLETGLGGTLFNAVASFGFYAKKLLVPLPLNFAIAGISPYYFWLGLLLLPVTVLLAKSRQVSHLLLAAALLLLVPAVALGLFNVAWTPYADRYAYLATPFFVLGFIGVADRFLRESVRLKGSPFLLAGLVLLLGSVITVQRNILWQDKFDLYEDAVRKSPDFATVRNALAQEYLRKGREDLAVEQLLHGIRLDRQKRKSRNHILYVTLGTLKMAQNDLAGAEEVLRETLAPGNKNGSPELLGVLANLLDRKYEKAAAGEQAAIGAELLDTYALLYEKTGNPFHLYVAAKAADRQQQPELARRLFQQAGREAPTGAEYKQAALLLAEKLN